MEQEPVDALRAVRLTREQLASRAHWSFPRHASVGVLLGTMVASFALPDAWPIAVVAACLVATVLIVRRDRLRDGFFVSGYRPGRTLPVTIALLVTSFGALHAAIVLKADKGLVWAPIAVGLVFAVLATAASILWERVYRQELMTRSHGQ